MGRKKINQWMKAWYIQVRGAQRELALSFFPPSSLLIPDLVLNKPRFLLLIPILGKPWSLIAGIRFPIHFPLCFHFDRWWWLTAIGSPRSRTLRRRVSMDMSARYHSSCYLFELIVFSFNLIFVSWRFHEFSLYVTCFSFLFDLIHDLVFSV